MGLFNFGKDSGSNIFGSMVGKMAAEAVKAEISNDQRADILRKHIMDSGVPVTNLGVRFTGEGAVTLTGETATTADAEKIALLAGNVAGIESVDNNITAADGLAGAETYTVQSGDTLSKIAEAKYGDANKYNAIFEANKPMLKDADKIYPGQVLRLPANAS